MRLLTPDSVVLPSSQEREANQSQRGEAVMANIEIAVSVQMWGSDETR